MRVFRLGLPLVLALTALPLPVMAQVPAPSAGAAANETDAMNEKARELYKEGNKLYRAEKWAQAEAAFEAAWALTDKKSKGLVNNLGQTEMHLGKFREAAEHLSVARRLAGKEDKQLPDIERDLAEAKKKIGAIVLTVNLEGAQLLLNDKPIGKAPLIDPVFVDPGKVTLTAFKDAYHTATVDLDVAAGQEVPVSLELKKPEAPQPSATVTATVPPPPTPPSKVPAFVLGGVGVAGMIVGAALLGTGHATHGDVSSKMPRDENGNSQCQKPPVTGADLAGCEELRSRTAEANTQANAGAVTLAMGGVVVGAGVAYFLWTSRPLSTARPTTQVLPVVGQQGGGLVIQGSF